jgi:Family of unknown function (DUF5832)
MQTHPRESPSKTDLGPTTLPRRYPGRGKRPPPPTVPRPAPRKPQTPPATQTCVSRGLKNPVPQYIQGPETMTPFEPISTKIVDHLSEDKPLKEQAYCCLSVISPEDVIVRKDAYATKLFLESVTARFNEMLEELLMHVPESSNKVAAFKARHGDWLSAGTTTAAFDAFMKENQADIDKRYSLENGSVCCTRGIKIRGSYATLDAAKGRCQLLRSEDPAHDVYVAEVGKWCPFSAAPSAIGDVNYAESELNALMGGYKEKAAAAAAEFDEETKARVAKAKEEGQAGASSSAAEQSSITVVDVSEIPADASGGSAVSVPTEMFDAPGDAHAEAAAESAETSKKAAPKKRVVRKTEAKPPTAESAGASTSSAPPRTAKKAPAARKPAAKKAAAPAPEPEAAPEAESA